ncbi:MAG: CARDB domain-containing protein [Candidatus Aminicenantaceae bacterium]
MKKQNYLFLSKISLILVATFILGALIYTETNKQLDIFSFYTNTSVKLLANQLPPGRSLGSSDRDSKNPDFHYSWAKRKSLEVIKQELIEKFKRIVEIKELEGKQALAWWYALVCINWANLNVDFGSPVANSLDWNLHEKWAVDQPPSVLLEQLIMRINKIFRSYIKPTQKIVPNLFIHPKNVLVATEFKEGTIFVWYELNAKGQLEANTIEMGIFLRRGPDGIWLKKWKLDSYLMDILRTYGIIQQSFKFKMPGWEGSSSKDKYLLSVHADPDNRINESNENDNVVEKEFAWY